MALKNCRECGKEVAKSAKTCPHCGVTKPGRRARSKWLGIAVVGLLFMGFVMIMGEQQVGTTSTSEDRPATPELQATVQFTGTQLVVRNDDAFAWRSCKFEINPGIVRGGWSTSADAIASGETVTAGIMTFTKSGGERFNPATHQLENVTIGCETPSGRGYWSGRFQ